MTGQTLAPPTPAQADETPFSSDHPTPRLWSVAEYYQMAEAGILQPEERVELLEGVIVTMSPIESPHKATVYKTMVALTAAFGPAFHVDDEIPVRFSDMTEPQPDVVVAVGAVDDCLDRHPEPADVRLLVEVSDSTLAADRTRKALRHARAGIPEYWIVNLVDRRLEVHQDPSPEIGYGTRKIVLPSESVAALSAPDALVLVSSLLPRLRLNSEAQDGNENATK